MNHETMMLRETLASGQLGLQDYLLEALAMIRTRDAVVGAFEDLNEAQLTEAVEKLDTARRLGHHLGPLFGLPVGVKDIIDVAGYPTGYGIAQRAQHFPLKDATLVRRLRAAGALVFGKTTTTPLASREPSRTRHPLDPRRGPGGSSSGSAAAVAAGFTPLAIGTQTNGSVIRPAAFCGVPALKPSFGLIPRTGVLMQSPTLDQVGFFARDLDGLACLTECLSGDDGEDAASRGAPHLMLRRALQEQWTRPPRFAVVIPPAIGKPSSSMQDALDELLAFLGDNAESVQYDYLIEDCLEAHAVIHAAEIAHQYDHLANRDPQVVPRGVAEQMQRGRELKAGAYFKAMAFRDRSRQSFQDTFDDFDVILTLSALDSAPESPENTGDPRPCTPWSLLGFPALHVPLFSDKDGLPLGVQIVAGPYQDARTLSVGKWLMDAVANA